MIILPGFKGTKPIFHPYSIPDLNLWYDASDLSTVYDLSVSGTNYLSDGTLVGRLESKYSPPGFTVNHMIQATADLKPKLVLEDINGLAALECDTFNDALAGQTYSSLANDSTVFFVGSYHYPITNSQYYGFSGTTSRTSFSFNPILYNGEMKFSFNEQTAPNAGQTFFSVAADFDTLVHVHTQVWQNHAPNVPVIGNKWYRLDGEELAFTSLGGVDPLYSTNFGSYRPGIYRSIRRLCEVLVYRRKLSSLELSKVENYLMQKWGVPHQYYPLSLSGLSRWYSASDVILNSSTVSQFNDKTGNSNHATQPVATQQPTLSVRSSYRTASFDGANDIINFLALNPTGDFTIYWVGFMRETAGNSGGFFGESAASINSLNTYLQGTYWYTTGGDILQGNNYKIYSGNFYILAITRTGTTIRCEVNGADNSTSPRNSNPTIGQIGKTYNGYAQMELGEFLVYNAYHDATTREHMYDWILSNYNMTSLLLHMDGDAGSTFFKDSSPNSFAITAYGNAQLSTSQSKFGGSSAYFDGVGDYLSATGTAFNFGVGDFTVEFWFRVSSFSSTYQHVAGNATTSTTMGFGVYIDKIYATTLTVGYVGTTTLVTDQWYHYACVRQTGVLKLYLDGVLEASYSVATSLANSSFTVGMFSATQYPFNGYIDEVNVEFRCRYTSNFTPPTSPYTSFKFSVS